MLNRFVLVAGAGLLLSACQEGGSFDRSARAYTPVPPATLSLMADKKMSKADPIVIRSYKKESEVEIWKKASDGKYALLKTFPICRWSGQLGPKTKEGDRQAPEGFYTITPAQMNPNSAYYLSFDTGYPNAYDRSYGRTGSNLMVHGACSSRGCFAMTDEAIAEVYAIAREAFSGGQRNFQFQSYPFRMTAKNLAQHRYDPNMPFWQNLKEGSDYFEVMREEPKVAVCGKRYVFGGSDVAQGNCSPNLDPAIAEKAAEDMQQVASLVAKGTSAIKLVYDDGDQHPTFRKALAQQMNPDGSLVVDARYGDVSRPEAIAAGPREILLDASGKPKSDVPATALALAPQAPAPQAKEVPAAPKPASLAAKPAEAKVAARQPVAVEPASPAGDKPFYQRAFSSITSLIGLTDSAAATPPRPAPGKPQASIAGGTVAN